MRARILYRLCKVNFADLQNTRCTIAQYRRIALISHNTDYTLSLRLCLCLAQCRARRAAWLCRRPPRLAPPPSPYYYYTFSHRKICVIHFAGLRCPLSCDAVTPDRPFARPHPRPPLLLQQYHCNISEKQLWSIAWLVGL